MNGIIVTSLDGGMLLFKLSHTDNFGVGSAGSHALQLSSSLFTLFRISQGDHGDMEGLRWILKGSTRVVFGEVTDDAPSSSSGKRVELLISLFLDARMSIGSCQRMHDAILKYFRENISLVSEGPANSKDKKALRLAINGITARFTEQLASDVIRQPAGCRDLLLIHLDKKGIHSTEGWIDQLWASAHSFTPMDEPLPVDESGKINSSKSLPPLPTGRRQSSSRGRLSQLFGRMFDRQNSPGVLESSSAKGESLPASTDGRSGLTTAVPSSLSYRCMTLSRRDEERVDSGGVRPPSERDAQRETLRSLALCLSRPAGGSSSVRVWKRSDNTCQPAEVMALGEGVEGGRCDWAISQLGAIDITGDCAALSLGNLHVVAFGPVGECVSCLQELSESNLARDLAISCEALLKRDSEAYSLH